jgi:protein-tyrosine phosphatase
LKLLEIILIIDEYLKTNKKVLICSTFACNRSIIIICAYLMWKNNSSLTESLTLIQNLYPFANPNFSLIHKLIFSKPHLYNLNRNNSN